MCLICECFSAYPYFSRDGRCVSSCSPQVSFHGVCCSVGQVLFNLVCYDHCPIGTYAVGDGTCAACGDSSIATCDASTPDIATSWWVFLCWRQSQLQNSWVIHAKYLLATCIQSISIQSIFLLYLSMSIQDILFAWSLHIMHRSKCNFMYRNTSHILVRHFWSVACLWSCVKWHYISYETVFFLMSLPARVYVPNIVAQENILPPGLTG